MKRLSLLFIALFVLVGCENRQGAEFVAIRGDAQPSSQSVVDDEPDEAHWREVDSNEWYDLFELKLTDSTSLVCAAFHKTDAQLGIGIVLNCAAIANERGFKFFTVAEASPTEIQRQMIAGMLPEDRVLESFFEIEFLMEDPEDSDRHVFDAIFMSTVQEVDKNKIY